MSSDSTGSRGGRGRRQVLAVAAAPGTTEPLRALVRQLANRVDVRALGQLEGAPGAVLATSPRAADFAPPGVPIAVWVADARELASIRSHPDVRVILSADRAAIGRGAVAVSQDALDVRALPFLPALVRARWRERYGLPARFVVAVGPDADGDGDAVTNLALAAAAVVSGPLLSTALALGTPVVTTPAEAERLGLRSGHEVEVAEPDSSKDSDALAKAIAADDAWSARCSFAARQFAELDLDLGRVADLFLDRLGLVRPELQPPEPMARFDRYLAALGTPATAPIYGRANLAAASLVPSADRS